MLIVSSLEGDTIEAAAYNTFNTWKLGLKGEDNGVLLMVATTERKVRIETGKGVVDELPDARASEIIQTKIVPHSRKTVIAKPWRTGPKPSSRRSGRAPRVRDRKSPVCRPRSSSLEAASQRSSSFACWWSWP